MTPSPDTPARIPWADRDDRNHPPEPHRCRCRCDETLDRNCSEHGWQVAALTADADPAELVTEEIRDKLGHALGTVIGPLEDADESLLEWHRCEGCRQPRQPCPCAGSNYAQSALIDTALTSVAADLYARGLAAGRRECAAELRDMAAGYTESHAVGLIRMEVVDTLRAPR